MGRFFKENKGFCVVRRSSVGWGGEGRRLKSLTHNLKVTGSNPVPATILNERSDTTAAWVSARAAFFVVGASGKRGEEPRDGFPAQSCAV